MRLSAAVNLHEAHRHAANIDLRSVGDDFVFAELPEAFVKEKQAGPNAEKEPTGWIRTAHDPQMLAEGWGLQQQISWRKVI